MKAIKQTKKDLIILKLPNGIKEIFFSHYEKKNGNGGYFFDTNGNKWNIKQIA